MTGTALAQTATKVAFDQTSTALAMTATPSSVQLTATYLAMTATPSSDQLTATNIAMTATTTPTLVVGGRSPTENQCIHSVVAGDTLYRIALNYSTTVDAIKYLNQLSGDIVYIGQELFVPGCYFETVVDEEEFESSTLLYICQSLFESIVVRSTSEDVSCREVDTETIDKHPLLAGGMLGAVEVLGYVDQGLEVCFHGAGTLVFLDPVTWPPTPYSLATYSNAADMTCARVDRIGTLVLVAVLSEAESLLRLTTCQITTRQTLRLRDAVAGTTTLGLVPYNVTLQAIARTPNWFNVSFLGAEGWISALYVDTDGICE